MVVARTGAATVCRGRGAEDRGVKVYVSVDMEGIAGIVDETQTSPAGRDYAVGRRLMTAEAKRLAGS